MNGPYWDWGTGVYAEFKSRQLASIADDDDEYCDYDAHSHHDINPPWWHFVSNDCGGNLSVKKSCR